jgi:hypothetical protein
MSTCKVSIEIIIKRPVDYFSINHHNNINKNQPYENI